MYVTVLYSYKKHCRIVRFSNENTMMHALDGLFLSSMHNNVTRVDFLIFHTPHFPHSSFSTLLIFHTPHFPHSSFSTLLIFHTPHIPHSSFSTLRTPRFPPNRNFESPSKPYLFSGCNCCKPEADSLEIYEQINSPCGDCVTIIHLNF